MLTVRWLQLVQLCTASVYKIPRVWKKWFSVIIWLHYFSKNGSSIFNTKNEGSRFWKKEWSHIITEILSLQMQCRLCLLNASSSLTTTRRGRNHITLQGCLCIKQTLFSMIASRYTKNRSFYHNVSYHNVSYSMIISVHRSPPWDTFVHMSLTKISVKRTGHIIMGKCSCSIYV